MNSSRFPELEKYQRKLFLYHYVLLTQFYIDTVNEYESIKEVVPEDLNKEFDKALL